MDEDPVGGALRLRGCGERLVSVTVGDGREAFTVDPADAWHAIVLNGAARSLLNGVGVELSREGFASDRGYLEPDEGQFDVPGEIDAWSGSAVLLRGSFLETVGPFDERLFLYYEDIDLSLPGASSAGVTRRCRRRWCATPTRRRPSPIPTSSATTTTGTGSSCSPGTGARVRSRVPRSASSR